MRTLKKSNQQSEDFLNKYCILKHIYGIKKNGTDKPICRAEIETQTWRTDKWTWGGGEEEGGKNWEIRIDIYTPPCAK